MQERVCRHHHRLESTTMSADGKDDFVLRMNHYRKELDPIEPSIVQQCIMPITVPVFEKDPIELVVVPGI